MSEGPRRLLLLKLALHTPGGSRAVIAYPPGALVRRLAESGRSPEGYLRALTPQGQRVQALACARWGAISGRLDPPPEPWREPIIEQDERLSGGSPAPPDEPR